MTKDLELPSEEDFINSEYQDREQEKLVDID